MLKVENITGGYGPVPFIKNVDIEVNEGEIVGVIGRNGMGKSTLLSSIFGLCKRSEGSVTIDDHVIPPGRPYELARRGASLVPENRGIFPTLTIAENLEFAKDSLYRPSVDPKAVFPLLTERAHQAAGTLSGGQQQQLAIARAVLAGSRLIVIDEVTHGLQPSIATAVMEMFSELAASGIGFLLVDQAPQVLARWADRLMVLQAGSFVFNEKTTSETIKKVSELLQIR